MKSNNSNTDTTLQDAKKWWDNQPVKYRHDKRIELSGSCVNELAPEEILSIHLKEIDPLKEINERGKLIADLTGNKVFDTPTSIFLRGENDALKLENEALKERVKELEIHLKPKIHY